MWELRLGGAIITGLTLSASVSLGAPPDGSGHAPPCSPPFINAITITDYTQPSTCDLNLCPSLTRCDAQGSCIRVPQTCAQCATPHTTVTWCYTNKELSDAKKR